MNKTTILFPTDYSPASRAALRQAATLAKEQGAELLVVHVRPPILPGVNDDPETQSATIWQSPEHWLAEVEPELKCENRTVAGDPAAAIANLARQEQISLIVMATTGRSGLKRLLLGSVAEEVIRTAPCPVCTIKVQLADQETTDAQTTSPLSRQESGSQAETLRGHDPDSTPAESLLWRARTARATDIHITPASSGEIEVRFRIDGRLEHYCTLSHEIGHALVTQLKVMANIDIADPFQTKEGRLRLPAEMTGYEARITVVPVVGGEAVAIRLLDEQRLVRPLVELGLSAANLALFHRILKHGEGLVLVTGPTGAGKTTTVYSMLNALEGTHRNIITIEDPVEFTLPIARQINVDLRHGLTLSQGLRTLLRMDPDVIMVGEIRDADAAEIAMRAASSGKYVFSTLHTRDVAATITAVRDLHIDNRSLAANLTGIISQRLVRRLCQECCARQAPTEAEAELFAAHGLDIPAMLAVPVGCPHCRGTGYRERAGVFEVVVNSPGLAEAVEQRMPEELLRKQIQAQETGTLAVDALTKVTDGITSLQEVQQMRWAELALNRVPAPADALLASFRAAD